jgi:hypothetical protein
VVTVPVVPHSPDERRRDRHVPDIDDIVDRILNDDPDPVVG